MTLPSYEEAVRSTIHHHSHQHANRYVWPMAPPPYDAVISSSSSSSSNPESAAGAAIESPPTVIHHQEPTASSCSQAEDEQRVVVAEQPALPGQHEAAVCIDHPDDSEPAASSSGLSLAYVYLRVSRPFCPGLMSRAFFSSILREIV